MKSPSEHATLDTREPIAIVGIGCRYPGANDAQEFWSMLVAERNGIREVPKQRFDIDAFHDTRPQTPGKLVTRFGGFIDDAFGFDADYFRISPREAARLDPQQRLILEVSAEAIDDAFLSKEELARYQTGVYVGAWASDWECHEYADRVHTDVYSMAGSGRCLLSGRVSFAFDLRGPSLTVDTGCSASLIAAHLACQSLWVGETSVAIVGGVNLVLDPKQGITFSQGGMLAPDGQCKAFDARADGFVRSDGCGVVVLMPLSKALERNARVYALIRGSGASNDGFSNGLLATPSEIGQELAIRAAYRSAGLSPKDVQYVEGHGTGTRAGDPVELRALGAVMSERPKGEPCFVGSVKSNIGHTEGASGIAGLIKAALAVHHRTIPKSLHCEQPTPLVEWDALNLAVATETRPWPSGRARAGVSSFGISGTDVHILLEEPPLAADAAAVTPEQPELLVLSAMSEQALHDTAGAYRALLAQPEAVSGSLRALAYTASLGRQHHRHRVALVGRDRAAWLETLNAYQQGEPHPSLAAGSCRNERPAGPVFVFSGQGSQWVGMGRSLLASEPVFRDAITRCDAALSRYADWSLLHELARERGDAQWPISVIQPSIFALQVALSAWWRSLGIEPALVIGHSMGEVAAAHVAGVLDLDDAARIISRRSQNLQDLAGQGGMLSIELGLEQAEAIAAQYSGRVGVAASNSLHATVLSGDVSALQEIAAQLRSRDVFCRELSVAAAAHSPQLDPLLPAFERSLHGVSPNPHAALPVCSTVSAGILPAHAFDAAYWVKNQREPVRFAAAMQHLVRQGHTLFLELSPHPILLGAMQQVLSAEQTAGVTLGSLRRNEHERTQLLQTLGQLHTLGQHVRFQALYPEPQRFVSLPRYAWQHEQFDDWSAAGADTQYGGGAGAIDACVLAEPLCSALHSRTFLWRVPLALAHSSYLADHAVQDAPVLPGAAYVAMALQAAERVLGSDRVALEDMTFGTAVVLSAEQPTELQLTLSLEQPGRAALRFYSSQLTAGGAAPRWTLHAQCNAHVLEAVPADALVLEHESIVARLEASLPEDHYREAHARKISYGPAFRGVEQIWTSEREALVKVALPKHVAFAPGAFVIHPALLDACWQSLAAAVLGNTAPGSLHLPIGVERVQRWGQLGTEVWAHTQLRTAPDAEVVVADVRVFGQDGGLLLETRGLKLRQMLSLQEQLDDALYELQWLSRPREPSQAELTGQNWLVLADRTHGVAAELARLLEAQGASCHVVYAAEGGGEDAVDPADRQAVVALIAQLTKDRPLDGIASLWPLDAVSAGAATNQTLDSAQTLGVVAAAHLVQALSECGLQRTKLWFVTAGAQPVKPEEVVEVAQAPLWAFARVLRYEFPEFATHSLDLGPLAGDPARRSRELIGLVAELTADQTADQIALRDGERSVLQLVRSAAAQPQVVPPTAAPVAATANYRLTTTSAGILDHLVLREAERTLPGPGEVEIALSAAGLNFIDVMKALAIYPGMGDGPIQFGGECAGTISALGPDVTGLVLGQRVVAMASGAQGCFTRFVRTQAALVAPCPQQLDDAQAATIPAVFLTAQYALHHLGRLARAERVLIHSAAGGVGLAAIELARRAGAEIFATAGSADKRAFLANIGIKHVYDSRSNAFAAEIMADTNGEGIDVVLNSLAGEAIPLSLALLRDDGRFLEIGKRDIYEDMQLGLLPFKRGLSFSHIDIGRLVQDKPQLMGDMLRALLQQFAEGALQPLPLTTYPLAQASDAFRHMAQAKHIGKIVLLPNAPDEIPAQVLPRLDAPLATSPGSYLITGGLGGLGLIMAKWLVEQGARTLVLSGRSPATPAAESVIAQLRQDGVQVCVETCDVARHDEVARLVHKVQSELPALKGIIHAAAVLDDGVALQLTPRRFAHAMAPKMHGAFNLHLATQALPLDFFVLFSSAASSLGSPGQGNYAAGNEFMDALAHYRRARGLPALSINWGPWRESGIAARPDRAGRLMVRGMGSVSDQQGLSLLERLLRGGRTQTSVLPCADFHKWREYYPSSAVGMLETLLRENPAAQAAHASTPSMRAALFEVPADERPSLLQDYLTDALRRVLRIPSNKQLDHDLPLNRFGIDSLMAVELKNRMEADLGVTIPVSKILLSTGLRHLALDLLELLPVAPDTSAPDQPRGVLADMTALDDDAAAVLLDDYFEVRMEQAV